jgi:hypothetical protein
LFFSRELTDRVVKESNRYMEQFVRGSELGPARAWKPVTGGEVYVVLGLFMLMDIIQNPTLRSYFTTNSNFHIRIWRHYNTRQIGTNM